MFLILQNLNFNLLAPLCPITYIGQIVLSVETVRWEEIAVYSNIRGKMEEKVILTEKTSKTNKLQNRKIIHMLKLLGVIHKFGVVIAVYQVLYAS